MTRRVQSEMHLILNMFARDFPKKIARQESKSSVNCAICLATEQKIQIQGAQKEKPQRGIIRGASGRVRGSRSQKTNIAEKPQSVTIPKPSEKTRKDEFVCLFWAVLSH